MKQVSANKNSLTKDELTEALQDYPTKQDLKDALQDYSTKQDLQIGLQDIKSEMGKEIRMLETRVDIKLEQMERRIDDRAREYNSQILTRFDQLANVLKTSYEERAITTHRVNQLQDDVEGLEKRVTKLENN